MSNESAPRESALVIGAGIGGMQSALLLAETGRRVYLLDSAPGIGGSLHLLDLTFPTNSCGLCLMLPGRAAYCPPIECDLHPNIELLPYAEVEGVTGEPGNFTVTVRHKPRYVSVELCNNCGLCAQVCPVERPDRYEGAIAPGKAIYRPPTRAIPPTYVIDMDYCTRCGKCVEICPTHAITLDDSPLPDRRSLLAVASIILSPGFEPFDARRKGEFGFGHYENVLTSIQFERMVSYSGSTGAAIVRPSDGRTPRRIAFIQCVGSRESPPSSPPTEWGGIWGGHCSSVCCMHTAKQVAVAKKLLPDLEVTVFYMDIRAYGKDFDEYFDAVAALPGVTYRRSMVSSIHQHQRTRDLRLNYAAESGEVREEDFDMVVLAVGFAPPEGFRELAQALGVELNDYGFCVTRPFAPNESSRPGVFVGGAFREPKDIPETVVEASASAAAASCSLLPAPYFLLPTPYSPADEWPRVGVFLCDCRGEIGGVVDLGMLAARAGELRDVAVAQTLDNACLAGGLEQIGRAIAEHKLNRVVVGGCAARLYEAAFARMMREAGLNPGLLERVNLRGEAAWVHSGNGRATAKALELIQMGVASARLRRPLSPVVEEGAQRALVIGGGLAGMTAALTLAEMGYGVDIVERSAELGGQLRELRDVWEERAAGGEQGTGSDPQAVLRELVEKVGGNERIRVYKEAQVESISGRAGQFRATGFAVDDSSSPTYGAVIVATGGREVTPTEYLYGQHPRVVTQRQLASMLGNREVGSGLLLPNLLPPAPLTVVMIQCVGSREPERPYCSRVCCTRAVVNALRLKELNPQAEVFILYREMRTYGFREDAYREARKRGVVFLRYELPDKPRVSAAGDGLEVRLTEPVVGEEVTLRADLLALSVGIEPNENRALADALGVSLDGNGFFQEEYPKMRPLDFTRRGVFVCGLAHSPRAVDETIVQARAAAMRAATVLAQARQGTPATVASVNIKRCSACGLCVEVCPFGARVLEPGAPYAEVVAALCQGCGACVVACPNKASSQQGVEVEQVYAMLDVVGG